MKGLGIILVVAVAGCGVYVRKDELAPVIQAVQLHHQTLGNMTIEKDKSIRWIGPDPGAKPPTTAPAPAAPAKPGGK